MYTKAKSVVELLRGQNEETKKNWRREIPAELMVNHRREKVLAE
jgi:hypothetical protein